mmetsp:Transcript_9424/g.29941  ORF Transcript_9424/g.29941 Transcript_9424/m.29941 type:complete len:342 (-) Transcript_9424:31-1056(-)
MTARILPSILSAPLPRLQSSLDELAESQQYGGFHVDVMDGHFVPRITFGPMLLDSLTFTNKNQQLSPVVDVHCMIEGGQAIASARRDVAKLRQRLPTDWTVGLSLHAETLVPTRPDPIPLVSNDATSHLISLWADRDDLPGKAASVRALVDGGNKRKADVPSVGSTAAHFSHTAIAHEHDVSGIHEAGRRAAEVGLRRGLAFRPSTPLSLLARLGSDNTDRADALEHSAQTPFDTLLILTVEPGYSGQSFNGTPILAWSHLAQVYGAHASEAAEHLPLISFEQPPILQGDGGFSAGSGQLRAAGMLGITEVVAGSAVFGKGQGARQRLETMQQQLQSFVST